MRGQKGGRNDDEGDQNRIGRGQTAGDALGKGVGEFSRIKIGRFSGLAPVTGNQEHDGAVSRSLLAFLTSWESVMKKDGKDILAADQALHQADKRAALR